MASKKRKVDFSAEAILSEISQAREFAQNVQQFRESLSLVKIKEMLGTMQTVNFDVATYLVSIGRPLCLAFLYGWHFIKKNFPRLAAYFDNSAIYFKTF